MLCMVMGTSGRSAMRLRRRPEQRKQRSSMRLADFRRRMEMLRAQAAKLLRLWSVVWLQPAARAAADGGAVETGC